MSERAVGRTVVRLGGGLVVGVVLGVAFERAWSGDSRELAPSGGPIERAHASEVALAAPTNIAGPDSALAPVRSEVPIPAAAEVGGSSADVTIAQLRAQLADLENEIARLRAELAEGSPRRRSLRELIAANDLVHAKLYEEIVDLIVNDPESVTEDPRRALALVLRLIDETGLSSVEPTQGMREVAPEPRAPELRVSLRDERSECGDPDRPGVLWNEEELDFHASLKLPQVPEGWSALPLAADVQVGVHRSDLGVEGLELSMEVGSLPGVHHVRWSLEIQRESAALSRSPWRCADDARDLPLEKVTAEWRWIDEMFDALRRRGR